MNKDFWLDRWKQNKTGWHQSAVEPALVQAFSGGKVTQVFVPFCGKSLDLVWLAEQGYNVIGVELSVLACEMFFKENKIRYQKYSDGAFQTFKSENIEIWNGDFFDLNPVHLQKIGAVYDRAALIALPREMRKKYAEQMLSLLRDNAKREDLKFLQIILIRNPQDTQGPPFSVSDAELRELYGSTFEIKLVSHEKVDMGESDQSITEECVYTLKYR